MNSLIEITKDFTLRYYDSTYGNFTRIQHISEIQLAYLENQLGKAFITPNFNRTRSHRLIGNLDLYLANFFELRFMPIPIGRKPEYELIFERIPNSGDNRRVIEPIDSSRMRSLFTENKSYTLQDLIKLEDEIRKRKYLLGFVPEGCELKREKNRSGDGRHVYDHINRGYARNSRCIGWMPCEGKISNLLR